MKSMSCKMKTSDFFDAFDDVKLKLTSREKDALEKKYDPSTSGTLNLQELVQVN